MHAIIKLDQPIRVVFLLVLVFSLRVILNSSTLVMRGGSYPLVGAQPYGADQQSYHRLRRHHVIDMWWICIHEQMHSDYIRLKHLFAMVFQGLWECTSVQRVWLGRLGC